MTTTPLDDVTRHHLEVYMREVRADVERVAKGLPAEHHYYAAPDGKKGVADLRMPIGVTTYYHDQRTGRSVDVYEAKGYKRLDPGPGLVEFVEEKQAAVYHAHGERAPWESSDVSKRPGK